MLVSDVQQSDLVIHVSILLKILFPVRLFQNIEQSSLYCTISPCWLSILNIQCVHVNPKLPNYSLPPIFLNHLFSIIALLDDKCYLNNIYPSSHFGMTQCFEKPNKQPMSPPHNTHTQNSTKQMNKTL